MTGTNETDTARRCAVVKPREGACTNHHGANNAVTNKAHEQRWSSARRCCNSGCSDDVVVLTLAFIQTSEVIDWDLDLLIVSQPQPLPSLLP